MQETAREDRRKIIIVLFRNGDDNMKTESLLEVKEYYGNKYKPILKAFENKKVKLYQIDESCGKYLELSVLMENGNIIFVNHGISNSKPYNVIITPSQTWYGKTTRYAFANMRGAALCITEEKYEW